MSFKKSKILFCLIPTLLVFSCDKKNDKNNIPKFCGIYSVKTGYKSGEQVELEFNVKHNSKYIITYAEINDILYEVTPKTTIDSKEYMTYTYTIDEPIIMDGSISGESFTIKNIYYTENVAEIDTQTGIKLEIKSTEDISNSIYVPLIKEDSQDHIVTIDKFSVSKENYSIDEVNEKFEKGYIILNEKVVAKAIKVKIDDNEEIKEIAVHSTSANSNTFYFVLKDLELDFGTHKIKLIGFSYYDIKEKETTLKEPKEINISISSSPITFETGKINFNSTEQSKKIIDKKDYYVVEKNDDIVYSFAVKHGDKDIVPMKVIFKYKNDDNEYTYNRISNVVQKMNRDNTYSTSFDIKLNINFVGSKELEKIDIVYKFKNSDIIQALQGSINTKFESYDKIITNFDEFMGINDKLNGRYILRNDIDFIEYSEVKGNAEFIAEKLIGNFSGEFNGNGYAISNVVTQASLFESISAKSAIKNFKYNVRSFTVGATSSTSILTKVNNGIIHKIELSGNTTIIRTATSFDGIVGENNGIIQNIHSMMYYSFKYANFNKAIILCKVNNGIIQNFINSTSGLITSANIKDIYYNVYDNQGTIRDGMLYLYPYSKKDNFLLGTMYTRIHLFYGNNSKDAERLYFVETSLQGMYENSNYKGSIGVTVKDGVVQSITKTDAMNEIETLLNQTINWEEYVNSKPEIKDTKEFFVYDFIIDYGKFQDYGVYYSLVYNGSDEKINFFSGVTGPEFSSNHWNYSGTGIVKLDFSYLD